MSSDTRALVSESVIKRSSHNLVFVFFSGLSSSVRLLPNFRFNLLLNKTPKITEGIRCEASPGLLHLISAARRTSGDILRSRPLSP